MKIALGTVQWGLNYGISNEEGIPSKYELERILCFANQSGINLLDTASSYGNAEERIGNHSKDKFNIVTKIGTADNSETIEKQIKTSLKKLKCSFVYGCLFHDISKILKSPSMWREIQIQKNEGLINKIGVSIYNPDELEKLFNLNYKPEIVQLPFNIIDRRFEPYLKKLTEMKIEIHARSIFLQGLLLDFKTMKKFIKWKQIWEKYDEWLTFSNLSPIEACISHVSSYEYISKLVVGVHNLSQLKEIILAAKKKPIRAPKSILSTDNELINPSLWI
tara:strand:+ start:350 stop:1180 length:831 start_codon:yes stop_codon:yes gene_type:complete